MSINILVTGGTGMLGSHVLFNLTSQGKRVRALYRSESKIDFTRKIYSYYDQAWESHFSNIEWVECDLEDVYQLGECFTGIDRIYHCAAMVSFAGKHVEEVVRNNVAIAANVFNTALDTGVKRLLHVSSVAALGRTKDGKVRDEKTIWTESKENSAYARSKHLSELEAWRAYEEGLNLVIVNPSIIIGPGDWENGSSALFGKIADGFKFYSHGVNAYVDVRDVAEVMTRLMESDHSGERFVLISEHKSYKELFYSIASHLKVDPPSLEAKPWMGELVWRFAKLKSMLFGGVPMVTKDTTRTSFQESYYRNEKVKRELGFEFRTVDDSIRDFSEIYLRENS